MLKAIGIGSVAIVILAACPTAAIGETAQGVREITSTISRETTYVEGPKVTGQEGATHA